MFSLYIHALVIVIGFLSTSTSALPTNTNHEERLTFLKTARSYDLPIQRSPVRRQGMQRRGALSGQSGLGDQSDLLYTVPVELGTTVTVVNLDTGSSDLWVASDACQTGTCANSGATTYPEASGNLTGIGVFMEYGDSSTGTVANGVVGYDIANIAGIAIADQAFGVVNFTNNSVVQDNAAGILGLGFPSGSQVQQAVVIAETGPIDATDDFLLATYTNGPLLTRIAMTGALDSPVFAIKLERDTFDVSGTGQLTLGKLPDGVDNSSLTWVPVRLYTPADGGLNPPTFAPNEIYPFRWEIDIDAVYLDGQQLQDSTIPTEDNIVSTTTSALLDTGNSIIRGPEDVVNNILQTVSPSFRPSKANSSPIYPCSTPHTLAFQIGGQMFPIDPRDFVRQLNSNDATNCVADNIVSTDPPRFGATFRWSLGDPFFKSNLVAFHFGNLTHPSVDPPRIGIMSLVPSNAAELYTQDLQSALNNGGNFEQTSNNAPTASVANAPEATVEFGAVPSLTSLSATSTLTLPGTVIAAPTTSSRQTGSATAITWKSRRSVVLSICVASLSWVFWIN